MRLSSIILLIAVSILPGVKEYSSIKTSKINATNILKENEIDSEKVNSAVWNLWRRGEDLKI